MPSTRAGATSGPLPADLLGQITLLEQLVALIASHAPHDGPATLAAEASRRTVAVLDRLGAQRLAWLGRVEADGLWRADTVRSFPYWLAWREGRSLAVARREALDAARLRDHLPATLRSARAGHLTASQVDVLSRTLPTSDARCAALAHEYEQPSAQVEQPQDGPGDAPRNAGHEPLPESGTLHGVDEDGRTPWADRSHGPSCTADQGRCTCMRAEITGEQAILGVAASFDLRALGKAARRFALVTDPEADERGYRHAQDREHLDLSRTLGGYHLSGFLTEEHGQTLSATLDAAIGVPSKDDGLRPTQRRAIALAGVARSYLERGEAGGAGAGVRPHMTVLVPWRDFIGLAGPNVEGTAAARSTGASPAVARLTSPTTTSPRSTSPRSASSRSTSASPTAATPTAAEPAGAIPTAASPTAASSTAAEPAGASPTAAGPTAVRPTGARPANEDLARGKLHAEEGAASGLTAPGSPTVDLASTGIAAGDLTAELLSPGPTWLDGSGPVPRQVLERIAADCSITRVVFGPDSEVLDVGRSQRTFTSARRKAVVARDQGCVWPRCSAPVQISEIHHARVHWADGGDTSTDNAALLCWYHHRHVDRERIAMAWRGGWIFSDRGGYDRPWDPGFPDAGDEKPEPGG